MALFVREGVRVVWGRGRGESSKGRLTSGRGPRGGRAGTLRESSRDKRGLTPIVTMILPDHHPPEPISQRHDKNGAPSLSPPHRWKRIVLLPSDASLPPNL